jgi:hypothetical protein
MGGSSYKGKKAKSHIEERKNQRKKQETEGEEIERRGGEEKDILRLVLGSLPSSLFSSSPK